MSNGTSIASRSSLPESVTATCPSPRSSLTCVSSFSPVQPCSTGELRMWLRQAFPASRSPSLENSRPQTTPATCGRLRRMSFASYSLFPYCLRTSRDLFPAATLEPSSVTWPKWGSWGDGAFSEQETPERRTSATASGSWPTPRASSAMAATITAGAIESTHTRFPNLETVVTQRTWPTPAARDWRSESCTLEVFKEREAHPRGKPLSWVAHGGPATPGMSLNPEWVEWLMGWPIGWSDLKPLATDRFQRWSAAHGRS